MYTLLLTTLFLAFFILYNTSQKVKFDKKCAISSWIRTNRSKSKYIALSLFALSLAFEIALDGYGIGSFTYFVSLMFVGSAVIALYPTLRIKRNIVLSIIGFSFIVEFLVS